MVSPPALRRMIAAALLWLGLCAPHFAVAADPQLRILSDSPGGKLIMGEMTAVTIRALYDRPIANEALKIPASDAFDWIQTRADDWYEQKIDGKTWMVFERHLALWPRRSGVLTFGPVSHSLTIIDTKSQRQDVTIKSDILSLSVAPHPNAGQNGWHFAAHDLELIDELSTDPAHLPDGGTVTRRVTLRALGVLPEYLPPRPVVSENWLITFAAPVKRDLHLTSDGPLAEVIWEWQFRPEHGEPGVLEAVDITWFDARARQMAKVTIPTITIGYASYYTGRTPKGHFSYNAKMGLLLALGAGLICGAGLGAFWLRPEPHAKAKAVLIARLKPQNWTALFMARRRKDHLRERALLDKLDLAPKRQAFLENWIYRKPNQPHAPDHPHYASTIPPEKLR